MNKFYLDLTYLTNNSIVVCFSQLSKYYRGHLRQKLFGCKCTHSPEKNHYLSASGNDIFIAVCVCFFFFALLIFPSSIDLRKERGRKKIIIRTHKVITNTTMLWLYNHILLCILVGNFTYNQLLAITFDFLRLVWLLAGKHLIYLTILIVHLHNFLCV